MAGTTMTNDHRRSEERGIVDLLAAGHDVREVGGKAAPLARVAASGLRVPAGFVVTASADASAVSLRSWLAASGGERWAVRSSAVGEDASERSYAGQLESLLDVTSEDVPRAIERCRRSARALRVLRYAGSPGDLAVVVQRMVNAERAGVAFSADPSSGERGVVVIEAVRGLSDRLLHGERAGERWRVSGGASERVHALDEAVLSDAQAAEIAAIAARLEQLFGRPQDVEWAIEDGVIWVLQSRPITALPASRSRSRARRPRAAGSATTTTVCSRRSAGAGSRPTPWRWPTR